MLLQSMNVLHMRQKITPMVSCYEVFTDDGGESGELVAFVEQKRLAFEEKVTIYTDTGKDRVLAGFHARKVIDLGSGYEVTDGEEQSIGGFRKDFGKSLTNATWHLDQPGTPTATGEERDAGLAVLRRV